MDSNWNNNEKQGALYPFNTLTATDCDEVAFLAHTDKTVFSAYRICLQFQGNVYQFYAKC